jgi:hypothetical protein
MGLSTNGVSLKELATAKLVCLSGQEVGKMLKWLFRIGLGQFVTKLAKEYLHPSRGKTQKSISDRETPEGRKEA